MYRKLSNTRIFFRLFSFRDFSSKVPDKPVDIDRFKLPSPTVIDKGTIEQLEKISLVNFETVEGIEIVEEAIRFADQLFLVNTEGVKPLTTVLDGTTLALREDVVTEGRCRCDILKNAKRTEDDYFVAPPGNIPLETKSYDLKRSVLKYVYGPPGELLAENIRREWLYNVSLFRENNVLPFHIGESSLGLTKDHVENFLIAKEFNHSELPFGIVETRSESSAFIGCDPLYPKKNTILRYFGFLKPSEAEQFYYRWQLQRKRWWRKFSNDPGKFAFAESDGTKDGVKNHSKILAKFPWGDHEVETIQYHGAKMFKCLPANMLTRLRIEDGNLTKCLPHMVESWCSLDYATWTYLCDSYFKEAKEDKPVIRLNKKLAPFKFTAAAAVMSDDKVKQLLDLSHLIMLELRKEGISCLLPVSPPFGTTDLESQLAHSNALAIPYTAVLTFDSLQTGIFGLYSRETTLQEQVHLSKIKEYGQILMQA